MKVVERDGDSLRFVSPVPPVKRGSVWSKGDCQEGKQMILQGSKCGQLNSSENKTVDKVNNNDGREITEES